MCVPLTTIKDTCGGVVDIAMCCKSLIVEEYAVTIYIGHCIMYTQREITWTI